VLAPLPGGGWTIHHDSLVSTIARDTRSAGIETEEEPRGIFVRALPQAALQRETDRSGTRVGIVPDLCVRARLQAARGASAARQREARIERRYLLDIKTVHAGGECYHPRYIARRQHGCGGAVTERARRVPLEYRRAAVRLDSVHHPRSPVPGPVAQVLSGFPATQGLAFGSHGEWSPEVHELLRATATQTAQRQWRRMGARSLAEALGSITQRLQRRWAMVSMRGHARLRLSRLQYVGTGGFRAQAAAAAAAAQGWPGDLADPGFVPAHSPAAFQAGLGPRGGD
jgi:hypothetical protein